MTARLTVAYGRDADANTVARAADRALEGLGCHVSVQSEDKIRITYRNGPLAARFDRGEQLVVMNDGEWRIEPAPELPTVAAKRTPEAWCAEYGIRILDNDGWRSKDAPGWNEPLTLTEFYSRAMQCTASADWTRIASDVKAATS